MDPQIDPHPVGAATPSRTSWAIAAPLFALGLAARTLPILAGGERVFTRFPTEDGYLMLTIARNIALGLGMSTAAGTVPTNGTQPLSTLLWAAAFAVADGDRQLGVALVLLLELLLSSLIALAIVRLGRRSLVHRSYGADASLLAGAVWYASTVQLAASMNCQETTLYALGVLLAAQGFLRLDGDRSTRFAVGFGLLLGGLFWIRNDAVFLIAVVCLAHLALDGERSGRALRARLGRSVCIGLSSVLVAMPWLLYNLLGFGSLVPISGLAEMMGAPFGSNLSRVPTALAGYLLAVDLLPGWSSTDPRLLGLSTAVVVAALWLYGRAYRHAADPERRLMLLVAAFGALLCGYYGLFFGAPYFVVRYLFPLSPFLTLAWAVAVCHVARHVSRRPGLRASVPVAAAVLVGLLLVQNWNALRRGERRVHYERVGWIADHVSPESWVGGVQSGTIGFFHDRTLNLDGKVNPVALEARRQGRLAAYILRSPIEWLVDGAPILRFMQLPAMQQAFEEVARSESGNLIAFRRRPR